MNITVSDSAEFKRLLEALVDELIDARDHFRLHQDLDAAIPEYQAEFNQSAAFWTFTLSAHMDATLLRLCKAYDLYERKPSLNLRNFLETIKANLHLFDEANFRERLKNNVFVDSLARDSRRPDAAQLKKDLESVTNANPLVRNLTVWRNNYLAHRSRTSALNAKGLAATNPLLFSDIKTLIDNGLRVVNHYSSLFNANVHTSLPITDYKHLLDAVRRDLERRESRMQEYRAAVNAERK
jgi:hypothetical protein